MTVRVVVADDQDVVRAGLVRILEGDPGLEVVGQAADGEAAVLEVQRTGADVCLMDIRMPVLDGLAATRRLFLSGSGVRVVILTTFDLDEYVYEALGAGASGFLLKDARPDELLNAIRAVAAGDAVVAPSATRRLLAHLSAAMPDGTAPADDRLESLTAREREVLLEVARGATNSEIGSTLFMAEATVKTHIGHLLAKLQCRDRVGLVVLAYETGLIRGA